MSFTDGHLSSQSFEGLQLLAFFNHYMHVCMYKYTFIPFLVNWHDSKVNQSKLFEGKGMIIAEESQVRTVYQRNYYTFEISGATINECLYHSSGVF